MTELLGLWAPMPTPFTDDGSTLSEVRLARVLNSLIGRGVDGLAIATETGEFGSLANSERKELLELTLRLAANRCMVVTNVTANSTSVALDLAQHASRHGARAGILMPPYCGRYNDDEVYQYVHTIAQYADLPIVVVDPNRRIIGALTERIAEISEVLVAEPVPEGMNTQDGATTDEFALEKAICTPIAAFDPVSAKSTWKSGAEAPADICRVLRNHGPLRAIKAGMNHMGLDCGPARGPVNLEGPVWGAIADLFS